MATDPTAVMMEGLGQAGPSLGASVWSGAGLQGVLSIATSLHHADPGLLTGAPQARLGPLLFSAHGLQGWQSQ